MKARRALSLGGWLTQVTLKVQKKMSLCRHSVPDRLYDMSRHACDLEQRVTACPARVNIAEISIFSMFLERNSLWDTFTGAFEVLRCAEYRLSTSALRDQFRRYRQRRRTGPMKSIFKIHVRRRCVRGKIPGIPSSRRGGVGVGWAEGWLTQITLKVWKKIPFSRHSIPRPVSTDSMTCWDLRKVGCRVTATADNNNVWHHQHILNNFWLWGTFTGSF